MANYAANYLHCTAKITLHIKRSVLRMMRSMMKFSKGGEVTRRQM